MTELVAETAIMKIFDHPNVLQLLGVCVDTNGDEMLKAVLPYMANGDLGNFLKQKRIDPMNISEFANVRFILNIYMCTYLCYVNAIFRFKYLCITLHWWIKEKSRETIEMYP